MPQNKGKAKKKYYPDGSEKLLHICDLIIEWGLILIVFFVPLIFTTSTGADIFNLPRLTFLRILTIPIVLAWVVKLIEGRDFSRLKTPLTWPVLGVLFVWLLSSIFSLVPEVSFLGNYLRQEGFWTIGNFILLFFVASSSFTTKEQVDRLLTTMLLSGLVTMLYGLIQALGWDWISWASKGRPFSTLGNPDFFPHFLIMLLPIAIMKFALTRSIETKIYLLLYIGLLAFNVLAAQTRGSYVGLAISLPVLFAFVPRWLYKENRNWLIGIGAAVALLLVFLFLGTDFLAQISRVATIKSRFYIWVGGWQIFLWRPILGVGPDVLRVASPRFKDIRYSLIEPMNNPDRMHNQYLDEMIMRGAIGFFLYMWMLVTFFLSSFRGWKKAGDPYWKGMILGITCGVLAFLGQNIVAFGVLPTNLYFWMLMALNMSLLKMDLSLTAEKVSQKRPSYPVKEKKSTLLPFPAWFRFTVYALVGLIMISFGYWSVRFFQADLDYGKGEISYRTAQSYQQQLQQVQDQTQKDSLSKEINKLMTSALISYQEATVLNPWEAGYRTATEGHSSGYGNLLYEMAMSIEEGADRDQLRSEARAQWEIALKTTMYPENVYMMLGRSYLEEAEEKTDQRQELLKQAALYFQKGVEADPGDYPLYFQLASINTELGDLEKAVQYAEKGVLYAQPTENRNYSLTLGAHTNFNFGLSLKDQGKDEEAQKYLERSKELAEELLKLDPENTDAQDILSRLESLL